MAARVRVVHQRNRAYTPTLAMNAQPHPLDHVAAKINNAVKHGVRLGEEQARYFASGPVGITEVEDPETNRFAYRLSMVRQPPPIFSALAGDVISNLRSGLNLLYVALLNDSQVQYSSSWIPHFPIVFDLKKSPTYNGLPSIIQDWLDTLQPKNDPSPTTHPLYRLQELSNADKHGEVVVRGTNIEFKMRGLPPSGLVPVKYGDDVYIEVPQTYRDTMRPVEPWVSLVISVPGMTPGLDIIEFTTMVNFVADVVESAFQFFSESGTAPKLGRLRYARS